MEKVVYGEWDQEGEFADSGGMEPHGAHQEQTSCPGYLKPTLTLILHPISQGRVPPRRPTVCLSLRSWFVVGTLSECRRSCPRGPETSAPSGLTRAGAHVTGGSTRRLSEPEDQHLQVGGPCLLGGSSRFVREKSSHFFQVKLCSRGSIR